MITIFNKNKDQKNLADRWVLKIILNLWTFLTMALFTVDFLSGNKFDSSASVIGIIYLAILGIYVSEKEYIRWRSKFISYFIGEGFIIAWTVIMVIFVIGAPLSFGRLHLPAEFAMVYTSVVGAYAISQHSKNLYRQKKYRPLPKK